MRATFFAAPPPPLSLITNDRLQLHFNFNCCSLCDAAVAAAAAAAGNVCVCCGQLQQGGIKTTTNRKTERERDRRGGRRRCSLLRFFFGCWCDQILYLHSQWHTHTQTLPHTGTLTHTGAHSHLFILYSLKMCTPRSYCSWNFIYLRLYFVVFAVFFLFYFALTFCYCCSYCCQCQFRCGVVVLLLLLARTLRSLSHSPSVCVWVLSSFSLCDVWLSLWAALANLFGFTYFCLFLFLLLFYFFNVVSTN